MTDFESVYLPGAAEDRPGVPRRYRIIALEGIDGSGKTAVSAAVERELSSYFRTMRTRLSVQMGHVFRDMVDVPTQGRARYQDVIPGAFRSFTYLVDAAVQFRYLADLYNDHEIVLFDRWLPTYNVYCADDPQETAGQPRMSDGDQFAGEWRRRLMESIPAPDLIFYLKADPRAAALRVAQRGDWTVRNWSDAKLLADLTRLDARYTEAMRLWPGHIVDANAPLPQVVGAVLDRVADLMPGPSVAKGLRS